MLCVLLKVLLKRYTYIVTGICAGIKAQVTSFENKDIRVSMIFRINTNKLQHVFQSVSFLQCRVQFLA